MSRENVGTPPQERECNPLSWPALAVRFEYMIRHADNGSARTSRNVRLGAVIAAGLLLGLIFAACGGGDGDEAELSFESPAREVASTAETGPIPPGGDADDPAIWIHPDDPAQSTIIGTDKLGGLAVYDLEGNQIQYLADGDLNNVDLRDGFRLGGESVTLVTAADSATNRLAIYRVDPSSRKLVDVAARKIELGLAAYGSCMYVSRATGRFFVFVNSEKEGGDPGGEVEQWELFEAESGKVDARRMRRFAVGSQTEGCVADDELGYLYIGEETTGVWRYSAEPNAGTERVRVDSTGPNGHLEPEVEGLALAHGPHNFGYLIASSQGNNSFAVYRRDDGNDYVKSFAINGAGGIDAVEETDGIEVTTRDLGDSFPNGLLVAQDGSDDSGRTNFKLVPLAP
jgi:3-phytase